MEVAVHRVLWRGSQAIELWRWDEGYKADAILEFRDASALLDFLRAHLEDPLGMQTLRDVLAEELTFTAISRMDDHEVLEQLAWHMLCGYIKLVPLAISQPAVQAGISVQERPEATEEEAPIGPVVTAAPPVVAASEAVRHWIKFQVVDEDTNQPLPGVGLKIKLPTGALKEYTTDANGMVEINDLPHGTCDIEQMLDPDALEVMPIA
jgi:hypothetical protein